MSSNTIADLRYRALHSNPMRVIPTDDVQTLVALTDTDRSIVGRHLNAVRQYLNRGIRLTPTRGESVLDDMNAASRGM